MLCSSRFMNAEQSVDLACKILICSKFSHTSSVDALNLIKSGNSNFLEDIKNDLRNSICDLYKKNIDVSVAKLHNPFVHAAFVPVKVVQGNNVCCKCDKTFTIRIFQHRTLAPDYVQFTRKIAGKKFTDHPSINYLNLMDYTSKAYDFYPSVHTNWFNRDIYGCYLSVIVKDIKDFPGKLLPEVLPKFITALKLLDMEEISSVSLGFYFLIIDTILEKKYDDPDVLINIWKSALVSDRFMVCVLEKLTDHLADRSTDKLKWVVIMANFLQFDFYGAWVRGYKLRGYSNCPISSIMITGRFKEMKALLDNGFLKNTKFLASYYVLLRNMQRLVTDLSIPLERAPVAQTPIVREVLMFLIMRHIQKDVKIRAELNKCFYLLWSSIPDPTVTKQQLEDEKKVLCQRFPASDNIAELKSKMDAVVNSYDDLHFGRDRTPRSLSHLCRCFIRRSLSLAGTLPHGVVQLGIPKNLQSYLLLTIPEEI